MLLHISSNIIESVFKLLGVPIAPLNLSLMVQVVIIAMPPLIVSVGMGYFFYHVGPKKKSSLISSISSIKHYPCACYISCCSRPLEGVSNIMA